MKNSDSTTCEAFARAIARLGHLPIEVQPQVESILHSMADPTLLNEQSQTLAATICVLVEQHPELNQVYQAERQKLQQDYHWNEQAQGDIPLSHDSLSPLVQLALQAIQADTPPVPVPASYRVAEKGRPYGWSSLASDRPTEDVQQSQLSAAKIDILRKIDKRPCTTQDLVSFMGKTTSSDQVRAMVQSLWLQGYIDTLTGSSLLQKLLPPQRRSPSQPLDPYASLALTSKGHFLVHPVFRWGS
ncbi:MAG: hypothetical protein MUF49_04340 [Oculatellaceae cyanobacterium Prado106]|nr:hypothetical protein [Oculatellaceae cyanobacterium Prado106]